MSKAARLAILRRNLARQAGGFKQADANMAFAIWVLEKDFNVGPITKDFPLMKIFSLMEEEYAKKYKKIMKQSDTIDAIKTIGNH